MSTLTAIEIIMVLSIIFHVSEIHWLLDLEDMNDTLIEELEELKNVRR